MAGSAPLAMGAAARSPRGRGLLWLLLLLPAAAPEPPGSPPSAPTPEAQRLAPGAAGGGISTVCGRPKVTGKIYGGQDVVAGQWPWQASLRYQGSHICGGALIDSHWLLSTAHCFVNPWACALAQTCPRRWAVSVLSAMRCGPASSHSFSSMSPHSWASDSSKSRAPEDYQVLLGSTQLYQQTQHTRKVSVSRIIVHPDFEKFHPFGSDIAMLQLLLPVNFTSSIAPVCLPAPGMQLPSRSSCWITGWGMLSEDTPLRWPFHLQEGKVGLIENKFCNILYGQRLDKGEAPPVHDEMLCAGDFSTGTAICRGDSGGPLVCDLPDAWVLVGLASWGLDCWHPVYPSVFTSVAHFASWIADTQRRTPPPDRSLTPPPTPLPRQPLRAAGPPGPRAAPRPPRAWLPLLFALGAPRLAPQ
ncbi:putative serine protease 47 [Equus przewalskii]|uniref:Serine protease 47 n=1 Tax=Equus przewalskii TaxID=9798 RepID=A0ABM4M060_EQUPR